jgi:hypothetical protein
MRKIENDVYTLLHDCGYNSGNTKTMFHRQKFIHKLIKIVLEYLTENT